MLIKASRSLQGCLKIIPKGEAICVDRALGASNHTNVLPGILYSTPASAIDPAADETVITVE